jgi:hypothetical protein
MPGNPLKRGKLELTAGFTSKQGKIQSDDYKQQKFSLPKPGPLVIGYGAARHIGHANRVKLMSQDPTLSLFTDAMDLYDAEDIWILVNVLEKDSKVKRKTKGG